MAIVYQTGPELTDSSQIDLQQPGIHQYRSKSICREAQLLEVVELNIQFTGIFCPKRIVSRVGTVI